MALNLTPITTAIEEVLLGSLGVTRTIPVGTFKKGGHEGRASGAQQTLANVNARYVVRFPGGSLHEASPISHNASARLENLDVEIDLMYSFGSEVLESQRTAVLNTMHNDRDTAWQALSKPGNLNETVAMAATNIVGGALLGPYSYTLEEDWEEQMATMTLVSRAIVNISQAVG